MERGGEKKRKEKKKKKKNNEKKTLPHSKKLKPCNKYTQKEKWDGKAKQKAKNP